MPQYVPGTFWIMSLGTVTEEGDTSFRDERVKIQVMGDTIVKHKKCWILSGWEVDEEGESVHRDQISFLIQKKDGAVLGIQNGFNESEWVLIHFSLLRFPLQVGRIWTFMATDFDGPAASSGKARPRKVLCKVTACVPFNGVKSHDLACEQHAWKIEFITEQINGEKSHSQAWFLGPELEASFPGSCPAMLMIEADQNINPNRKSFIIIQSFGVSAP